jgi:hypothetical protein
MDIAAPLPVTVDSLAQCLVDQGCDLRGQERGHRGAADSGQRFDAYLPPTRATARIRSLQQHVPIVGGLLREVMAARLARTFRRLLVNRVSLITALGITREVMGNEAGVAATDHAIPLARPGAGLSTPPSTGHQTREVVAVYVRPNDAFARSAMGRLKGARWNTG